jgi:hypothetical protein
VRSVLDLKPDALSSEAASSQEVSGAHRLLNRLCGAVKAVLSNAPNRSLSVFIRVDGGNAPWLEVAVFDLLTRCGVRTKTGHLYTAAHCDTTLFGWCEADEAQAGRRSLRVVSAQPSSAGGPRGAAADIARQAQIKAVVRSELKASEPARATPVVAVDGAAQQPNEFRGVLYGRCNECEACEEYVRPSSGAKCEVCIDCSVLKHVKLSTTSSRSLAISESKEQLKIETLESVFFHFRMQLQHSFFEISSRSIQ